MRKELIRVGTVFDVYCLYEGSEPKYILKQLNNKSKKYKAKLKNEILVLKALENDVNSNRGGVLPI